MKNSITRVFLIVAAVSVLFLPVSAFAFGEKYVDRTFYVPYMPGADKVYGAYRVIAHTADFNVSVVRGNMARTGTMAGNKDIADVFQTTDIIRSDLIILTKNGLKVTGTKTAGNTVYRDTVWYETPEYVIGYFFDGSPLTGSSVMQSQGRPYFVAAKVSDLTNLFTGATNAEILKSLVNYQGASPSGKLIPIGSNTYIVSQNPDRLLFNWWQELSQEFLAENMSDIKTFDWQEISGYYDEAAYGNGKFSSLPVREIGFSDIPSNDEMFKLWESKKGILGKSNLEEHFTDYMTPLSPGTWSSPGKTFVSCDPNLLLRWLYNIPQKQGNPQIRVSSAVPSDFSVLKVDEELYRKTTPVGDPNVFFAFAPFGYPGSGVKIFFPYEKKFEDSRSVSQVFGETKSSIATLPENMRDAASQAGSEKFTGSVESYLYGAAGCLFVPMNRNSAISTLKAKGFGNVLKSLGVL